jgi:carbon-monoxide dehydrogenase medium subunit
MIPSEFDYRAADSVDDAIRLLADGGEDAKLLAGGHSLLPLMKLRFAVPSLLVDMRKLEELRGVEPDGDGGWRIGALTTHSRLQDRAELGVVAGAASRIADQQVRNRGTIGGSLAHADPASDMPAVLLAAEGSVTARGPGGERTIAAGELFADLMTSSLAADELLTEVRFPSLEGWGWGYEKFNRRHEDWAIVGVCALVRGNGSCEEARVSLVNMGPTPIRANAVEQALDGQPLNAETIERAAANAAEGTSPSDDVNGSADYKQHLARVLTARALKTAAGLG